RRPVDAALRLAPRLDARAGLRHPRPGNDRAARHANPRPPFRPPHRNYVRTTGQTRVTEVGSGATRPKEPLKQRSFAGLFDMGSSSPTPEVRGRESITVGRSP